jgi:hypothetical protein
MPLIKLPSPPARSLYTRVRTDAPGALGSQSGRCSIQVYFSHLADTQTTLLEAVLAELPNVITKVRWQLHRRSEELISSALNRPSSTIDQYRTEAWAHTRWRESLLTHLPCLSQDEAAERCEDSPWQAEDDLLWLPHYGRRFYPTCQFTPTGPPDPAWARVVSETRGARHPGKWELMARLLTPQSLLANLSPKEALASQPKRVLSVLQQDLREGAIQPLLRRRQYTSRPQH